MLTPDILNSELKTSLHYAARYNNVDIATALVEAGSSLNSKDLYGNTPMHIACYYHSYDVLLYLIQLGAKTHLRNKRGQLPLDIAMLNSDSKASDLLIGAKLEDAIGVTPKTKLSFYNYVLKLCTAMLSNNRQEATRLTKEYRATYSEFSPLHLATLYNKIDIVELILKATR